MRQEIGAPRVRVGAQDLRRAVVRADALVEGPEVIVGSRDLLGVRDAADDRVAVRLEVGEQLGIVGFKFGRREADGRGWVAS